MKEIIENVRKLKTRAKNRRDLGRYQVALSHVEEAIGLLEKELASTEIREWKAKLASELADCYGLAGGINRRWGLEAKNQEERRDRLAKSVRAYDQGYRLETTPAYGIVDSYNLLNRLVGRILYDPTSLSAAPSSMDSQEFEAINVNSALQEAEEVIDHQLREKRRGDIWALADLALVRLLLKRADPLLAYAAFNAAAPPDFAYESALSALRPLTTLDLPVSARLAAAVEHLEERRREM